MTHPRRSLEMHAAFRRSALMRRQWHAPPGIRAHARARCYTD